MNKPLKINEIIGKRVQSRLVSRARALMDLDAQLQHLLPDTLRPHCRLLAVNGTTLVLAADSPAWAARLRFHTHQLARQLTPPGGVKLRGIRIRVRPPQKSAPYRRQP
ncbi:MAG: DUF721 domain-containing protein [Gammaproteobacteria bacterium]|jgi:hypothetical protein